MPWAWLIRQVVRKKGGFHGTLGTMAKSATVTLSFNPTVCLPLPPILPSAFSFSTSFQWSFLPPLKRMVCDMWYTLSSFPSIPLDTTHSPFGFSFCPLLLPFLGHYSSFPLPLSLPSILSCLSLSNFLPPFPASPSLTPFHTFLLFTPTFTLSVWTCTMTLPCLCYLFPLSFPSFFPFSCSPFSPLSPSSLPSPLCTLIFHSP